MPFRKKLQTMLLNEDTVSKIADKAFSFADKNRDGTIDNAEVRALLQRVMGKTKMAVPVSVVDQIIKQADRDRSGTIDKAEFNVIARRLFGAASQHAGGHSREVDLSGTDDDAPHGHPQPQQFQQYPPQQFQQYPPQQFQQYR
mmetsp:Transcript_43389/g.114297  ORF Transcript_43389/g.114297 Transcript_43389/m.114297 type:complete len:143 (-) Transcript_43389:125-553(-)|eukprot:CAMPEP_0194483862 /NCGR_PEP_ID=MMETSP0253-20130528/5366_1 /TAXON_ID=2966 /ORGANISM="Noctiluca scintillans" /LENGTH=142 /DNA_ID=CAMNT_0039323579 /DNA_START=79 /DNA_END=507 /DNA_ORIENTATION=-